MPCLRHRSLADTPAACSFKTLMICSSVNLLLRIVRLLGGEQNPNLKSGAFQGSRSSAFSRKIASARALKIIGPITNENLTIIRHVRNAFAHAKLPIDFQTSQI